MCSCPGGSQPSDYGRTESQFCALSWIYKVARDDEVSNDLDLNSMLLRDEELMVKRRLGMIGMIAKTWRKEIFSICSSVS